MPRRLLGILIFLLVSVLVARAQGDIVLMQVGDEAVSKAEFEYYWNRSPVDDLQEYLPVFIDYKRKVLYARELGLDTLTEYRTQRSYYLQALETKAGVENCTNRPTRQVDEEWFKLRHVTRPLKQQASQLEEQGARAYLDSIHAMLKAEGVSGKAIGESLWIPERFLLAEWIRALEPLDKNEISQPFASPLGIHIVWWEAKEWRTRSHSMERVSLTEEGKKLRAREMEEALLVASLDWANARMVTEQELEGYFEEHRSRYAWNLPHYQGAVFQCKSKKQAKAIKKALKKRDSRVWQEIVRKMEVDCRAEYGLFQIGKNPYVDKLVFKCGGFESSEDYPHVFVMGKKVKGPDSWTDVRESVLLDYTRWQEKNRKDVLEQKYRVEIKEEVLKTVNNSRNN